jgi:hypothetical protein
MKGSNMTKAEKIKNLKTEVRVSSEFKALIERYEGVQIGADEFALTLSLEGKVRYVTLKLVAKNEDFDVFGEGGAIEQWEFTQKQNAEKEAVREKKKAEEKAKTEARKAKAEAGK